MDQSRESYLAPLRAIYPWRSDMEIDLLCSADKTVASETGLSPQQHRELAMREMFPSRAWHEWRKERMESIQYCLEHRIQELMWIGSSNSNKTADMADAALALWWTKPEKTSIYVTSPYEDSTETGLWACIQEQFDEAKERYPKLPGKLKKSNSSIVLYDKSPRSFIRVATVDQIGKLVGKKSRNFEEGLLIILADELPAFAPAAARAFVRVMDNLWSVPNLLVIGAGNFALTSDALGIFCDPSEEDIPRGYDGFDPDRHFRWKTKRGGLCLRFDGLQSPNVKAGRDIYPFVTTLAYIEKHASQPGGLKSPGAMRFVRSAPLTNLDEFTITNAERINAGGCYDDDYTWTRDEITKLAFVDPGFGGDPCVFKRFRMGRIQLPSGGTRQILELEGAPDIVPVEIGLKDDQGGIITVEEQVAVGSKKLAEKYHIPFRHVGYDGSLRAGLGQKMVTHFSPQVVPIDSQGPATQRPVGVNEKNEKDEPILWKDRVDRFLSEMWFAAASAIDSFQIRGLKHSPKAAQQLCTRRWTWQGSKKKKVQTKQEYKDMLKEQLKPVESPNEADALVGGLEIARRLGFVLEGVTNNGGSLKMVLDWIEERKAKAALGHFKAPTQRAALPSGRLRGIARATSSRVRLNR